MPTRLESLVIDVNDLQHLARWWAEALGWLVTEEADDEIAVEPPEGTPGIPLVFGPVPERKSAKNRLHLDLTSRSPAEQAAIVERLVGMGASRADIGQRDVPWIVLADPEGNEFCVLEHREEYDDAGVVAAVVVDCADPSRLAGFWTQATGWPITHSDGEAASLRPPDGVGPHVEFVRVDEPKLTKNRLHLDVAPFASDDHAAEVARLAAAGAERIDIGQGDVPWVVLADPEGNEFCVLTPR